MSVRIPPSSSPPNLITKHGADYNSVEEAKQTWVATIRSCGYSELHMRWIQELEYIAALPRDMQRALGDYVWFIECERTHCYSGFFCGLSGGVTPRAAPSLCTQVFCSDGCRSAVAYFREWKQSDAKIVELNAAVADRDRRIEDMQQTLQKWKIAWQLEQVEFASLKNFVADTLPYLHLPVGGKPIHIPDCVNKK